MNRLIIEGVPPYDGTHEFEDFTSFTNRELHRIKKQTGIRVGEFAEALEAGDNDLLVALATVILERTGIKVDDDILWDADAGAITMDFSVEAEEENPTQASLPLPEDGLQRQRPTTRPPLLGAVRASLRESSRRAARVVLATRLSETPISGLVSVPSRSAN